MEFSSQENRSRLPLPSPGYLPHPGIKPGSPPLLTDSLLSEPPGENLHKSREVQSQGNTLGLICLQCLEWGAELTSLWAFSHFRPPEIIWFKWDGWIESLTQWTWVWANPRRWWRSGKPGMLQSMGSQSQTQLRDWTTNKMEDAFFPYLSFTINKYNVYWYFCT